LLVKLGNRICIFDSHGFGVNAIYLIFDWFVNHSNGRNMNLSCHPIL